MSVGMEKVPCVYIMASHRYGTLYVGVTAYLGPRTYQHQTGAVPGFTKRYGLKLLVWYEVHPTMESAIVREKHIKAWKRDWKIRLIERLNPTWRDLYEDLNA